MKRRTIGLALLVFFTLLLIWSISLSGAQAEEKIFQWFRVDANITVHEDGTFTVHEILRVHFVKGTFHYGYREIPTDKLQSISDVRLWDEEGKYTEADTDEPRTFTLHQSEGKYRIVWYFLPLEETFRTFHISYRVHGGLRSYPDGDQLWWKAVFPDRTSYVVLSTVTVTVPAPVQTYAAYFVPAHITLLNERTVRFNAEEPVPPRIPFEVRVQWPHGVIPITPAPWQAQADADVQTTERITVWRSKWVPIIEVGLIFGGIGLGVIGLLVLLLLWYQTGRDIPVPRIDYLPEPPSDLAPGLAGLLVDMEMKPRHILATVVDFAQRGLITIEERQHPVPKREGLARYLPRPKPERDIRIHLVGDFPKKLPLFERRTLRGIMGRTRERRLRDLRKLFYKHVPRIHKAMEEELVNQGLLPYRPSIRRKQYTTVAKILVGLAFLLFVPVAFDRVARLYIDDRLTLFPLGALLFLGIATAISARFMPRRTAAGAEEAERWRAFRRYLKNLRTLGDTLPAQKTLERYLPYAIAFGVEKTFLQAWDEAAQAGRAAWPTWYYSSLQAPAGGSTGGPAPISGISQGIGGSLAAISAGLGAMLSEASTALASNPTGSSSGFSGGGGGGGGFG